MCGSPVSLRGVAFMKSALSSSSLLFAIRTSPASAASRLAGMCLLLGLIWGGPLGAEQIESTPHHLADAALEQGRHQLQQQVQEVAADAPAQSSSAASASTSSPAKSVSRKQTRQTKQARHNFRQAMKEAQMGPPVPGRHNKARMTREERRQLRQDIHEAGRELYRREATRQPPLQPAPAGQGPQ